MSTKVYKFDQSFKDMIKETGYNHIALESPEGERLVSYNPPKSKSGLTAKFDEIRRRLLVQPDGLYRILAQVNYSGKSKPDVFIIQKGATQVDTIQEKAQVVKKVDREGTEEKNALSFKEALKNIEEVATLRVENENLKKQVTELKAEIVELENELDNPAEVLKEETSGPGDWIEKTLPSVMPFIDKFLEQRDRQIAIQENKLSNGSRRPMIVKNKKPRQAAPEHTYMDIELDNERDLQSLYDEMENLTDDQFDEAFDKIQETYPELAELIAIEFQLEEAEEEGGAE